MTMTQATHGQPKAQPKLKLKKGDLVKVIMGNDKGKEGQILTAMPKENKIVVEGVNVMTTHKKDRQSRKPGQAQPEVIKGGIVKKEAPMFACKVMLICPTCKQPTRVGYAYREGEEKLSRRKYRICKNAACGKPIDTTI